MSDLPEQNIVPAADNQVDINRFESTLLAHISTLGLPTDTVFVPVDQRMDVFRNIEAVVNRIPVQTRAGSIYISKFLAAAAAGLFDAALNYMWDQTIVELRHRIAQYDLSYFFDLVEPDPARRKKLSTEADLSEIEDFKLIKGAYDIELISEIGHKHLDLIRFMRNKASAAHPNQNEITGLQLSSWLQTCVMQVINLPLSTIAVDIKRHLASIKTERVTDVMAAQIARFFTGLTQERVNSLTSGFFGIYVDPAMSTQTRQNIQLLLPLIWDRVDEPTRYQFGIKYAQFASRIEQQQQMQFARQFLEVVSALSYAPDSIRGLEIKTAMDNLLSTHRSYDNFHNEPAFARQLQRLVGDAGRIPEEVVSEYVLGVVDVFITNGYGRARNAEPIYLELLKQFDPRQSLIACVSFRDATISSKLQFSLCQDQFNTLLEMMISQVSNQAVKELIEEIHKALKRRTSAETLKKDKVLATKIDNLKKILNV